MNKTFDEELETDSAAKSKYYRQLAEEIKTVNEDIDKASMEIRAKLNISENMTKEEFIDLILKEAYEKSAHDFEESFPSSSKNKERKNLDEEQPFLKTQTELYYESLEKELHGSTQVNLALIEQLAKAYWLLNEKMDIEKAKVEWIKMRKLHYWNELQNFNALIKDHQAETKGLESEEYRLREMLAASIAEKNELLQELEAKEKAEKLLEEEEAFVEDLLEKQLEIEKELELEIEKEKELYKAQQNELLELKEKTSQHIKDERKTVNLVQEIKGNVRVLIRLRPILSFDRRNSHCENIINIENNRKQVNLKLPSNLQKSSNLISTTVFNCERAFEPEDSQEMVFEEVNDLIFSVFQGFNVCIFAYGNTGSGKTYTILGGDNKKSRKINEDEQEGLIPRTLRALETRILRDKDTKYSIRYGFYEFYRDKLYNLLDVNKKESKSLQLTKVESNDKISETLLQKLQQAKNHRSTGKTEMNSVSSRSHAFFQFEIKSKKITQKATIEKKSYVTFIDLAGSEKMLTSSTSTANKLELQESVRINSSLTSLRDVLEALAKKTSHVPYRNSKFTSIMQPFLGQQTKTAVIINISNSSRYYYQTKSSLEFASSIPMIESKSGIIRNEVITPHKIPWELSEDEIIE